MKKETKEKVINAATNVTTYMTGVGAAVCLYSLPAGAICAGLKSKAAKIAVTGFFSIGGAFMSTYIMDKVESHNREIIADIVELLDRRKEEVTKITEVIE